MDGQGRHSVATLARVEQIQKLLAANTENKLVTDLLSVEDCVFYRDYLLEEWEHSKSMLETAKETEMSFRKAVVAFAFNPEQKSGTERIALGNGYQAKAVKKVNYGFIKDFNNKTNKAAIDAALSKIEAMGEVPAHMAGELIKWTPDLSLTSYNKLDELGEMGQQIKAIVDSILVVTDGAPTLEIIAPKGKR